MFKVDMDTVIQMMVDKELNRKIGSEYFDNKYKIKGIVIPFILRVNDQDYRETTREVSMLFHGNTSVYYKIFNMEEEALLNLSPDGWINTSNHDSCWRTDGFRFLYNLYFEMSKKLNNNNVPKASCSFYFNLWPVKHVEIIYEYKDNFPIILEIKRLQ